MSLLHLSIPSPSAPQLGWYTDTNLNPLTTTATSLSPNHFCCPPFTHFSSASPLNITPAFFPWISTTLSSSSLNQTTPSSSALSSVSNTISHPSCLTLSATLLSLLLFVSLILNLLTFQVTTNSNAINPNMPASTQTSCPPPPPTFPPSLISPSSTLPPAPNSPSCRPRVGMDPYQTIRHQHPPLSLPYPPPQAPNQPQRDAPHVGPRSAPAFVWFRVGSRAATPFPHRSDGGLLERLVLRRDPGSSSIGRRSLCRDRGGGQYVPPRRPPPRRPPPRRTPPRPVEAKRRTG